MLELIKKFKAIPEEKRLIFYGRVSMIKNLVYFLLKIIVGIVFKSWILIAIAIYNLMIGVVKENCSRGLKKNGDDNLKNCKTYIRGGIVLVVSSIFYVAYSIIQLFFQSNTKYHMIVAIAIAAFATYTVTISIVGLVRVRTRTKTMIIKEYRLTTFAQALNNVVLAQIAILSFATTANVSNYNALISLIVGCFILAIGVYIIIDGVKKQKQIIKERNP